MRSSPLSAKTVLPSGASRRGRCRPRNSPALEISVRRIEAHRRVRPHAQFIVPHRALGDGNAVSLGAWAAREGYSVGLPLSGSNLPRKRLAQALYQMMPSSAIARRRGRLSGWARRRFVNRERCGIDAGELTAAELEEIRHALRCDHHPIGVGFRRRRAHELRLMPASAVPGLRGKRRGRGRGDRCSSRLAYIRTKPRAYDADLVHLCWLGGAVALTRIIRFRLPCRVSAG